MKILFLVVGLVLGFGIYAVVDLRDDYSRSIELAEANCNILVLSDPNAGLAPTEIDCNLTNRDYLISFEVNETKGVFVECLPGALFRREIVLGECNLHK